MKKLLLLLAGTLLLCLDHSVWAQKKGKPLYTHPFGVQGYTYRDHWDKGVEAVLDTIQKLGITELESGVPKGLTAKEFRAMCAERGISIPSTGGSYDQLLKDPMEAVERAKALGASYVMAAWIPHERGQFNLAVAKKAVADFNQIGKVLKENGLTFCYHPHGFEYQPYEKGTLMDYIIENTNPDYVSYEMDILWTYFGGGDPVKLLKKYGSRWKLMHLKDLKKGVEGNLTGGTPHANNVPLGQGQIDIEGVIRAAKEVGVRHFFIEDESEKEFENVPHTIAYLKSLRQ